MKSPELQGQQLGEAGSCLEELLSDLMCQLQRLEMFLRLGPFQRVWIQEMLGGSCEKAAELGLGV